MSVMNPLPSLIRASAHDAASRRMRAENRSKWNEGDWDLMCETQERLIRNLYGKDTDSNQPDMCFLRFQIAERLERAGQFRLDSKVPEIFARIETALS